jgi:transcriptional regulator with XRE-family HTH domain
MQQLRLARKEAGLSLKEVAGMLSRSREWLRLIESGKRTVTPERREQVLQVISRLNALRSTVSANVQSELKKVKVEISGDGHQIRSLGKRVSRTSKNLKT